MAEYWGLEAIAKRMGWRNRKTPVEQVKLSGFLMFKRRRGSHPRLIYYTNDNMIAAWEIARSKIERDQLLGRRNRHGEAEG